MNSDPLHRLAWLAADSFFAPRGIDVKDRVQIAYTAILEAHSTGCADEGKLLRRANIALTQAMAELRGFRGQIRKPYKERRGLHPNAMKYWTGRKTPFEEKIIENLAVHQVLNALPDKHRRTLVNAANGIRPRYNRELQQARQAAWELWHDWETPQHYLYHSQGRKHAA